MSDLKMTNAVEYPDGSRLWYLNGKRHRADGPAVEYSNGTILESHSRHAYKEQTDW